MLLYYFPKEHYGKLLSFLSLPVVFTMWLIDPLYRAILGGKAIEDANFVRVSLGFVAFQGNFKKYFITKVNRKMKSKKHWVFISLWRRNTG
jgi:hypothetical protein